MMSFIPISLTTTSEFTFPNLVLDLVLFLSNSFHHNVWYTIEMVVGFTLFLLILLQRVHIDVYKSSSGLNILLLKVGQFGLYIQGMMGAILFIDGINSMIIGISQFPLVLTTLLGLSCILSKTTSIVVLYKKLIKKDNSEHNLLIYPS